MKRIVVDTNILVSGAYDDLSASASILEACTRGELTALLSPALQRECVRILAQAVQIRGYEETVRRFLAAAEIVHPSETPRVVPDDPDDDKVIAAAVAGDAHAIVTNDRHLLDLDPHDGIRILRPVTFAQHRGDAHGGTWHDLARMIGIGH